ncbi:MULTISPECIES: hypothetical protein [unclassified Saccharothrix]|uniref:hypothetical protein n=1 Tax=unclassified Saccharothrix TaxID=2593673 RepID=UPI00307E5543
MNDHHAHTPRPRSVAELAASSPAWQVETDQRGRWLTAERRIVHDGRRWLIGLTPVRDGVVALVLWSGDVVAGHARGSEADMCARADRWVADLMARRLMP